MTSTQAQPTEGEGHFKDAILDALARHANVAQFVSFGPGTPDVRFVCLRHAPRDERLSLVEALSLLLGTSVDGSINVRAFDPYQPKSHEFLYGLTTAEDASAHIRRLSESGLYTIANETIDVSDGGVSGVMYGGIMEFAPDNTPRCVEKPGTMSLPRELGLKILETVYGFEADLPQEANVRTEFSLHPIRQGLRTGHTLVWEEERTEAVELQPNIVWPNHFTRFLGDKVFGLLMADGIGLNVPAATVVNRRVAPFGFGRSTSTGEVWTRTAPIEPVPGKFTTKRGWVDPYKLLESEDPAGDRIASVIAQDSVDAAFSGAASTKLSTGTSLIEGVRGHGDQFMLGEAPPEALPARITSDVREALRVASVHLGEVRLEWVHDGDAVWIVQLHRGSFESVGRVIYPGEASVDHEFRVEQGLEALRSLAEALEGTGEGIVVVGQVGVTSHFGDVLRRAKIPSRIEARGLGEEATITPLSSSMR